MQEATNFMIIFQALLGAFLTYSAIRGSGMAYNNEYPESMKADAEAMYRKLYWFVGPTMIVGAAIDYFKLFGEMPQVMGRGISEFISMVFFVLDVVVLIVFFILFRKKFKQQLKGMTRR